jgi:hydroxylamine reductase
MSMFCFQCEQTAGGKGCSMSQGVCGKKEDTALRQGRADRRAHRPRAHGGAPRAGRTAHRAVMAGCSPYPNVNLIPTPYSGRWICMRRSQAPCGGRRGRGRIRHEALWTENEDIRPSNR